MKKDIENRKDIELFVNGFYNKISQDKVIGFIFNNLTQVNWIMHLPQVCDFWENSLFYTGDFDGNSKPMHSSLQKLIPLSREHFKQWNNLFIETVNEYFDGINAELAKQRALGISAVIENKLVPPDFDNAQEA